LDRTAQAFSDVSGVVSTSDYPGAAAAALLAQRLSLPSPTLESVLRAGHKYLSRLAQKASVPEAVPRFHLVDPQALSPLPFAYPCFLKPVKGSFSIMTQRVETPEDLETFMGRPSVEEYLTYYVHLFDRLLGLRPELEARACYFLAEELLTGTQVTVEGYAQGSEVTILGTVDSILEPNTKSFLRFDYPSRLPDEIQFRLGALATRAMEHLGWTDGFFNVEMMVDPVSGRMSIIEINPRLCGQFADLHLNVEGVSTYETLLNLALGKPCRASGRGAYDVASSFPLRVFEPSQADTLPDPESILEIEARFPGCLIWIENTSGDLLDNFEELEDGHSARYGVVNVAGEDEREVLERFRQIETALGCRFSSLAHASRFA
ncbi:MAG TPA: ATP-grasp domain-containing protein, partial [Candidatus Eisenbacteria bacterium]|nr:ATP-grasp domain-containing protein [Candidatus Eisenbacteria bacterium]